VSDSQGSGVLASPAPSLPEELWLFDRSRYVVGLGHCAHRRFLEYHSGPQYLGIRRVAQSIPLSTGGTYHLGVALILTHKGPDPASLSDDSIRQLYRPLIQEVVQDYAETASKSGLMDLAGEEARYKIQEQACLCEGMLWGFVRGCLRRVHELFEILEVEQEDLVRLTEGEPARDGRPALLPVVYQVRPDVLLRVRETKLLATLDLKTGYRLDDKWEAQFTDSVQMATQGLGAEERLKERVAGYYVLGVQKGYQDRAKDEDGNPMGPRRQRSPFTYLYHLNTGISDEWESRYEYKDPQTGKKRRLGKDWRLEPVWQQDLPRAKDVNPAEEWAWKLPMDVIYDQFKLVGMFERHQTLIDNFLQEAPHEEIRWQERLHLVRNEGVPAGQVIPRSWNCFGEWGRACSFLPLCYNHAAPPPYETRMPHHEAEAQQAGVKVVYFGEEQEVDE